MNRGNTLPAVCILLVGLAMLAASLTRAVLDAQRSAMGTEMAEQALTAAESALSGATGRLSAPVTFPASACSQGLCANLAGPDPSRYSWLRGATHLQGEPFEGWRTGHWVEDLGETSPASDSGCPVQRCRYARVVAGGWRSDRASSLGIEAIVRVDAASDGSRTVRRLSWRLARAR